MNSTKLTMPVFLGQLVYTSFPGVGLRALASAQVPMALQQAFIQHVVYQHWDSYNPPKSGYRAVYLHQVTPEHTLFGWLYNHEVDDLGRSHVPYFICYYLAELLQAVQLENIFTCLQRGPVALIDRQNLPDALETIVVPDLSSYQPARIGVAIPSSVRDRSHIALKQRRLLDLFVPVDEWGMVIEPNVQIYKQQTAPVQPPQVPASRQDTTPVLQGNLSQPHLGDKTSDTSVATSPNKGALLIGIGTGVAAALALMVGSYYFVRPIVPASKIQQYPVSIPSKNTDAGNITLADTLTGHSDVVWCVAISPDGQTLISSSEDQTIKLWNLHSGKLLRTLSGHSGTVWSIAVSPDGQTLASGSSDNTIKIWHKGSGKLLRTLSGHSGAVWSITFSADGQTLASSSSDNTIKIWKLSGGELLRTLSGHSEAFRSIAVSPDGQILASGSSDNTIKLWSLGSGKLLRTLKGHTNRVISVTFSPDGQILASGSVDKTIKIWNLSSGKLLRTLARNSKWVNSVAISPDGRTLASGIGYIIKIWDLNTGKLLHTLSDHSSDITSVSFSANGKRLVSASRDKTIKIWRL